MAEGRSFLYFSSNKDTNTHQYCRSSAHCFSCVCHVCWRGNSASTRLTIFRMLLMLSKSDAQSFPIGSLSRHPGNVKFVPACTRVRSKCRQVKLNGATAGRWRSTAVVRATSHFWNNLWVNLCLHSLFSNLSHNSAWLSVKVLLHWNLYNKAINPC